MPTAHARPRAFACRDAVAPALLAAAALAFLFAPSWLRWHHFGVQSYDFGIYAHGFWNALHGRGFVSSVEFGDHQRVHASPILYALLPLYALAPSPLALLALSSGLLAVSVLPLWALSRRAHGPRASALLCALFVAQPAVASLDFDFHESQVATPLLLTLLWAAAAGRAVPFALALVAALACKEDVALVTLALGLTMLRRPGTPRRLGLLAVALSLAWLPLSLAVYIPAFGGDHGALMARYARLGSGWGGLLLSPLTHARVFWPTLVSGESARYLGRLFASFGFLPLLAPRALVVASPALLQNLLADHAPMRSLAFHYEAELLPALAWGAVDGLSRLTRGRSPRVASALRGAVPLALLLLAPLFQARWGKGLLTGTARDPDGDAYAAVLARVPRGASVASPAVLQPRLADRPESAYADATNPRMRERPPPYEWLIVPVRRCGAGAPEPGLRVEDLSADERRFVAGPLALLHRRPVAPAPR